MHGNAGPNHAASHDDDLRPVWNRIRDKNPDWIDIGVAAALAAFLIHGLVDYMLVGGLGIVVGIALGIALRRDWIGTA